MPCLKDAGHIRLESTMNSYPELASLASFPVFFDEHVRKAGLNAEQMGALNWLGVLSRFLMVHQRHRIMLRDVDLYRCEPGGDAGYASVSLPLDIYSWQRQDRRVPAERMSDTLYVADSCVSMEDDNGAGQFWNVRLPSDWVTFLPRDDVPGIQDALMFACSPTCRDMMNVHWAWQQFALPGKADADEHLMKNLLISRCPASGSVDAHGNPSRLVTVAFPGGLFSCSGDGDEEDSEENFEEECPSAKWALTTLWTPGQEETPAMVLGPAREALQALTQPEAMLQKLQQAQKTGVRHLLRAIPMSEVRGDMEKAGICANACLDDSKSGGRTAHDVLPIRDITLKKNGEESPDTNDRAVGFSDPSGEIVWFQAEMPENGQSLLLCADAVRACRQASVCNEGLRQMLRFCWERTGESSKDAQLESHLTDMLGVACSAAVRGGGAWDAQEALASALEMFACASSKRLKHALQMPADEESDGCTPEEQNAAAMIYYAVHSCVSSLLWPPLTNETECAHLLDALPGQINRLIDYLESWHEGVGAPACAQALSFLLDYDPHKKNSPIPRTFLRTLARNAGIVETLCAGMGRYCGVTASQPPQEDKRIQRMSEALGKAADVFSCWFYDISEEQHDRDVRNVWYMEWFNAHVLTPFMQYHDADPQRQRTRSLVLHVTRSVLEEKSQYGLCGQLSGRVNVLKDCGAVLEKAQLNQNMCIAVQAVQRHQEGRKRSGRRMEDESVHRKTGGDGSHPQGRARIKPPRI